MNRWPGGWWIAPSCIGSVVVWLCLGYAAFGTVTVRDDLGGSLSARIATVEVLRASGEPVRIIGTCASACTMYLGLPNACVSRRAVLAFHGPQTQFYGVGLPQREFEAWSQIIADHYPPRIRAAYLRDWRYTTVGMVTLTGAEAIRMGVRQCH